MQEALQAERRSANAEQQAKEEHSNAEQAEEEPSNAEEDALDGETEEHGEGQPVWESEWEW
jgi:hypothetical protein